MHVLTITTAVPTSKNKDNARYKLDDKYTFRDLVSVHINILVTCFPNITIVFL